MDRQEYLDRPFAEVAYNRRSRATSVAAEALVAGAIVWLHGAAGAVACGAGVLCGLAAGAIDRSVARANWERLSRITMRELIARGKKKCFPPDSAFRNLLPMISFMVGGVTLFWRSPRGLFAEILTLPILYILFLLGRDLLLGLAPPSGPRGQ